ncbi:MAG TPA: hypothetical protein VF735_20050 [Pyrinomonadaceae bacterium]
MSQDTGHDHISKKRVVYSIPGMEGVEVRRDVEYEANDALGLTMDIYYPPDSKSGARVPAVVIVAGYKDAGFEAHVGCRFKEMGSSVSWGQLMAASGLAAITYTNREPSADIQALLEYVRRNAAALGIDENRIGLWASSGNVPVALSALMLEGREYLKCAALCYGIMLDAEGESHVARAAKVWGFSNPCAGKTVADLPKDTPLFIVRAGRDEMPHLNETIDRFVAQALACNLPITLTNHPDAPHAFDLFHDSETTREIIRRTLSFMRFHLLSAPAASA